MTFRARLFFSAVALIAILHALPAAGIAARTASTSSDDPAVLLKNAVPRDLIPPNFRNEAQPTISGSGSLRYVTIRFNGPGRAGIEFELTSFSKLPVPIQKVYEMETNALSDAEILERNLGIGDASVHFQRRAPELVPFDIRSQTVRAYWESYKLQVDVRDYHTVGGARHLSHEQAALLARDLAKTTLNSIRGEGGADAASEVVPDVLDKQAPPRVISQTDWEKMKEDVAVHARYDGDPLKEGYIGFIFADSGAVDIYDYSGRHVTGDPSRRTEGDGGRIYQRIRIGDTLRTGGDGLARIQFADGGERWDKGPSVINIGPDSNMTFNKFLVNFEDTGRGKGSVFDLITGAIGAFIRGWGPNTYVSFKTGVTVCGIRGSEVFISYDPRSDRVGAHVIEGHMDVTNTTTGAIRSLTNNQKLVVKNGAIGPVQTMSREEWDGLIAQHGLGRIEPEPPTPLASPVKPAAAGAIPELGAMVTDLMFYEEGVEDVPHGQRIYRTYFDRNATRYVRWELRLKYPAPGRRVDFAIDSVWTGPDGSELTRDTYNGSADANWTNSYHDKAWGWDEPGHWAPGTYTVRLFHGGRQIASDTFRVAE